MSKSTDIRILDVSCDFEEYQYRTPLKFGGVPIDNCGLLNVCLQVQTTRWERSYRSGIYDA